MLPACDRAELTAIRIMGSNPASAGVPQLDQRQGFRKLAATLSFAPCQAPGAASVRLETRFDIDSDWLDANGNPPRPGMQIPYQVQVDGQAPQSSNFVLRTGQDLFGRTGPSTFMMVTENPLTIPAGTTSANMIIDMSGIVIIPRNSQQGNQWMYAQQAFNAPLYLQAGNAAPLQGTVSVIPAAVY